MDTTENRLAEWFIFYISGLLFFTVGAITSLGLEWYSALTVPSWTPSTFVIVVIWCVVFIGMALSAAQVWKNGFHTRLGWYGLNVVLLLLWNYVFFGAHLLSLSLGMATLVLLAVIGLVASNWRTARKAAWLLFPYLAWMLFALPLTYFIAMSN